MDGHADLDAVDRDALERAWRLPNVIRCVPNIWKEIAGRAVARGRGICQLFLPDPRAELKPWQNPPRAADEDEPDERPTDSATSPAQMLAAGVSRYDPDPLKALARAKRRSSR